MTTTAAYDPDDPDRSLRGVKLGKPVTEMTLWELAQAIAIFSDQAVCFDNAPTKTEEEMESNKEYANRCFGVRNDCVAEIRDREIRHRTATTVMAHWR